MAINSAALKSFLTEVWNNMGKSTLVIYFVLIAVLSLYLTCTLWLAMPKEPPPTASAAGSAQATEQPAASKGIAPPPAVPGSSQANAQTAKEATSVETKSSSDCQDKAGDPPKITNLDPKELAIGENYLSIAIIGCNLEEGSKVKFNGAERSTNRVDSHELIAQLQASDFAAPGKIAVSVEREAKRSNSLSLKVKSASELKATWKVWGYENEITLELRLILLVLFTGALAATVAGLKSFVEYIGDEKFKPSWYMFYYAEPIIGCGLAFIFYLVLRAGFLAGTNVDVKAVNPFGFVALSALVGLFSDAAFRKLNEIFDSLLQAKDTRSGKLSDPVVTSPAELPSVGRGAALTPFRFAAQNGKPPYTWSVVGALPAGLDLSQDGVLTGNAPAAPGEVTFTVKVTDSAGASGTQQCKLTVQ